MPPSQNFTFKREPVEPADRDPARGVRHLVVIKLGGEAVGVIHPPHFGLKASSRAGAASRGPGWNVRFRVAHRPTEAAPYPFEWRDLGRFFETEEDARYWLKANPLDSFQTPFKLYRKDAK